MRLTKRAMILASAMLCAAGALMGTLPAHAASGLVYTSGNHIRFVDANLRHGALNDSDITTNGANFLAYLADPANETYIPDILSFQEMKWTHNNDACQSDATCIPRHWCSEFASTLAQDINDQNGTQVSYDHVASNYGGGACIIWRAGRFTETSDSGPIANYKFVDGDGCELRDGDGINYSIAVQLTDTQSNNKTISVGSLHLGPTPRAEECISNAIHDVRLYMTGDLKLVAGDTNVQKTEQGTWYNSQFINNGYTDDTLGLATWGGSQQLDWIFGKGQTSATGEERVLFSSATGTDGKDYSDHRGQLVTLSY